MKCLHCGGELKIVAGAVRHEPGVFDFAPPARFDQVATGAFEPAPVASWREKPARALNKWDVLYPLTWGCIKGVALGVPTLAGALILEVRWPWGIAGAVAWATASAQWFGWDIKSFVMSIEEKVGRDIDRDGIVGQPPPPPAVEVWQRTQVGKHDIAQRFELPVDAEKMRDFAQFVLSGGNLSREAVCASTRLSQGDYNALMSVLEERGFIDRTGNQRALNRGGLALLRDLI